MAYSSANQQKIKLAKGTDIYQVVKALGHDIDSKGFIIGDSSLHIDTEDNVFYDFAHPDKKGDVISFYQYYKNYQGSGVSYPPVSFFQACDELIEIRRGYDPNMITDIQKTQNKKLPLITSEKLNEEMLEYLFEGVIGADKTDPNYKKGFPNGEMDPAYLIGNTRNKFAKNTVPGKSTDLWRRNPAVQYGNGIAYNAVGYLSGIRGISEETVKEFMDKGYLFQTTYNWKLKDPSTLKKNYPFIQVEDGLAYACSENGTRWRSQPKPVGEEGFWRYSNLPRCTFASYDKDGNLNFIWEKGCSVSTNPNFKNSFAYKGKDWENYAYRENPFFYDPSSYLAFKNPSNKEMLPFIMASDKQENAAEQPVKMPNKEKTLCVFEGVIDLMSYIDICKENNINPNNFAYLSVEGVGKSALKIKNTLETYGFDKIDIYFDRDTAGQQAADNIVAMLSDEGYKVRKCFAPTRDFKEPKDMNEVLVKMRTDQNYFFKIPSEKEIPYISESPDMDESLTDLFEDEYTSEKKNTVNRQSLNSKTSRTVSEPEEDVDEDFEDWDWGF